MFGFSARSPQNCQNLKRQHLLDRWAPLAMCRLRLGDVAMTPASSDRSKVDRGCGMVRRKGEWQVGKRCARFACSGLRKAGVWALDAQ